MIERSARSFNVILNTSCCQRLFRILLSSVVMFLLSLVFVNHTEVNSSRHSLNDVTDLLCAALAIPFMFASIIKMLDKRVLRLVVPVD